VINVSTALERPIGPTTVDEWLTMDAPSDGSRLELIYGYLHVSPAPSGLHQLAGDELRAILKAALGAARRKDLYVITAVNIKISTPRRTALIPDVVVLSMRPARLMFEASDLVVAVEVWSPNNTRAERKTKMAEYAGAGVPFFWGVKQDRFGSCTVTAYYLEEGQYVEELTAKPGTKVTVRVAAPVPVTFDPADLDP
jgi:Uma2 family endonuclease